MTKREQTILTFFLSRALNFGWGLSVIFNYTNNHSIFASFIGGLLGFLLIIFLTTRDFSKIRNSLLGKIIIFILSLYMINTTMITFCALTTNFYLTNTPPLIIALSLYVLVIYGIKNGLKSIARLGEILSIISAILLVTIAIFILSNINLSNFLPLSYNKEYNYLLTILTSISYSVTPVLLLLFNLDNYNRKSIILGYSLGVISILINIFGITSILGSTLAKIYRYPEFIMLKKVSVLSFLDRIENFLALKFFIDILMTSLLATYNLKKIIKKKYLYIFGLIFIFISLNTFITHYQNTSYLYYYSYLVLSILLIITIIFSKRYSKKE